uniref:Uncharacterized protein n=1 Tax=Nelumbo nucifera TaxID=4432 RepID=A0A822ZAY6_NELNU|nr:TPA_asm: hypothetical protein HUJ06_014938 [Nelumbo nucifera]
MTTDNGGEFHLRWISFCNKQEQEVAAAGDFAAAVGGL